jgi:hypothetical protein
LLLVAWSRLIGYAVLWVVIGWWTFRDLHGRASPARRVGEVAVVVGYTTALIVGIDRLVVARGSTFGAQVVELCGSLAFFALGFWPVVRYVDRRTGVLTLVGRTLCRRG